MEIILNLPALHPNEKNYIVLALSLEGALNSTLY